MSFDSQRPGLPRSLDQTGTTHRPLSSLLSSSKSLIKLSVEDSSTCLLARHSFSAASQYPINPPMRCSSQDHLHAANFSCVTLSSPRPADTFCTWMRGALVFGEVFEKRIKLSPSTFSQLFTAAWFNAVELSSQHLFGLMLQPQKKNRVWRDITAYLFLSRYIIRHIVSVLLGATYLVRYAFASYFLKWKLI